MRYVKIARIKDKYYKARDKNGQKKDVLNAYVTFRSVSAQERALGMYDLSMAHRICAEYFCCLSPWMRRYKIMRKGFLTLRQAQDPEIITWENLGHSLMSRLRRLLLAMVATITIFGVSFFGIWSIQLLEKTRFDWVKSDCTGDSWFTNDLAFADYFQPK